MARTSSQPPPIQPPVRFGELLVDREVITLEELQRGLSVQTRVSRLRIGEVLVAMGLLALHDFIATLQRRTMNLLGGKAPAPLGNLLVAQGSITHEQLTQGLALQKAGDTRPLGRILVESGVISNGDLIRGLAVQMRLRHATAMAMLGASLSVFQPTPSRANDSVSASSTVQLSLTIAPRMELQVADPELSALMQDSDIIEMPSMISLPDVEGRIASVLTEPMTGTSGQLMLRNAAGDSIPFGIKFVSPDMADQSAVASISGTSVAFPNLGGGGQPIVEFDLSAEDLKLAQAGGYHATVVIMVAPEL